VVESSRQATKNFLNSLRRKVNATWVRFAWSWLIRPYQVPIVVVFTKFDKLVSRMEERLTPKEHETSPEELCLKRAEAEFEKVCVAPLKTIDRNLAFVKVSGRLFRVTSVLIGILKRVFLLVHSQYPSTLSDLIHRTQRNIEGDVWIVSAMAQRASAQAKIKSSIE